MLVYSGQRLFVLRDPALVQLAVPQDAWILLDSNVDFLSPPQEVSDCNRLIVQAASPAGRTAWADKIRGPHQFCVMRPWTLEELFVGSSLQPKICSGHDMRVFFNKFGGSARHVYVCAPSAPATGHHGIHRFDDGKIPLGRRRPTFERLLLPAIGDKLSDF
ncbi:hypothetical protein B0H11DRAFT_2008215 [Mycena galericulata]|nr:hypothetical protein B0H11DRAFT_2008215 [Mycena galericulata]